MESISPVLIVAIIFAVIYGVIKLLVLRKERLTMIERGTVLPEIKTNNFSFSSLKYGLFFIGIGLGVLIANILVIRMVLDREVAYFAMIFLFGGIALVSSHFLEKKSVK